MAAQTLKQITKSLGSTYDPQIQSLQGQMGMIPQQYAEQEKGLQAQQGQAFDEILGGARSRGLGFSGIPLSEQAKYTSTQFLPALANLRQQGNQQKQSLQDAILGIYERRNTQAQGLYQSGLDRAEQQRQFNLNYKLAKQQAADARRAAASGGGGGFSPSFGGGGISVPAPKAGGGEKISRTQRKDGGFNFSYNGQPISAASYAALTKTNFRDLLSNMAKAGDKGAKAALGFVGNDYGYDPRKIKNSQYANIYNSLVWGTNRPQASYSEPKRYNAPSGNVWGAKGNYSPLGVGAYR